MSNALQNKKDLGWVTITHPFHPFQGKRFRVLKMRRVAGEDTLILQGTYRGTFAVPQEWTDQVDPRPWGRPGIAAPILCFRCLVALADLVEQLGDRKVVDK